MTLLDRGLQRWRIARARPFIPRGARLLDVGCHDAVLFRRLGSRLRGGVGIDPLAPPAAGLANGFQVVRGMFPADLPPGELFDAVTCLAVLEHVPRSGQRDFLVACADRLMAGGVLVLTVPALAVDSILRWLRRLRLVDGMSLDQHHGYAPAETIPLAQAAGFVLVVHRRFQLGLNNLFVFRKPALST